MSAEKSGFKISINYGAREAEALRELEEFYDQGTRLFPNKSEIVRRAIDSIRYLAETDDRILLQLLSDVLKLTLKKYDPRIIRIAKNLSFAIYSSMISKKGILGAELFETIPLNLMSIENLDQRSLIDSERERYVAQALEQTIADVEQIYLPASEGQSQIGAVVLKNVLNLPSYRYEELPIILDEPSRQKSEWSIGDAPMATNNQKALVYRSRGKRGEAILQ